MVFLRFLLRRAVGLALLANIGTGAGIGIGIGIPLPAAAQGADEVVLQAREALRANNRARLIATRDAAAAAAHPLAQWTAYWELSNRMTSAQQPELDAFYVRWPGTYVEDRLRNDWLLELGQRRDWANFRAEFPRFRMNDDRDVTCFALLTQHLDGQDVRSAARTAWWAQRDGDDGCGLLGSTLVQARVLSADDAWQAARLAAEFNRPRSAGTAAAAVSPAAGTAVTAVFRDPVGYLKQPPTGLGSEGNELALLALMRLAASDPEAAAVLIDTTWQRRLPPSMAATAWAHAGKQAALKRLPPAADWSRRAWQLADQPGMARPLWSDDLLAWQVRAALQQPASDVTRWGPVQRAIDAMSPAEQRDSAWVYWKARAGLAQARPGAEGDGARATARAALAGLGGQISFYGKLAAEELGGRWTLPQTPQPLTAVERDVARELPGLSRALRLIDIGLRNEGVREWNFTLRGMHDRELLAAAQWACERQVWDRCINTSERTRVEIDLAQRFPTPYRDQVLARARDAGVDAAFMFGLIRQESRFIVDARSQVGASGLMQVMPATARWTAGKIGLPFRPDMINDRDVNLRLGASYLRMVLDDFGGSQAMAAAAYNAGPGRPRRWREGATVEPAAWAEGIPFAETRDYVKKVLSNAVVYSTLLARGPTATATATATNGGGGGTAAAGGAGLKARLGPPVGPRVGLRTEAALAAERDIP